jgi:very-short-patch-repair endonuclease
MGYQIPKGSHSGAWALTRTQHDVVARRQLIELGFNAQAIKHRVAKGRLHPIFRGVYAVGRPHVTQYGWWMGAVLCCGPGAVLSHESAAALWGFRPITAGPIDVTAPSDRRPTGITAHRRILAAAERTTRHNIPVTTVVCTLIDLAARLDRDPLEVAIGEADKLGLTNPERLRSELDRAPRRPGLAVLRTTLDARTFTITDTELERRFLPIARRARLPLPATQAYVNGFRVDFYWPDLKLVVETDGLTYHRTPAQQATDRVRDQVHAASELTPLRFTRAQVKFEPAHVESILAAVAHRLERERRQRELLS